MTNSAGVSGSRGWGPLGLSTYLVRVGLVAVLLMPAACATTGTAGAARETEPGSVLELGRSVFLELSQPSCAVCHTLQQAGAVGRVGPDLDQLQPEMGAVLAAVRDGVGVMPAQSGVLTEAQIEAVARYVSEAAAGGN